MDDAVDARLRPFPPSIRVDAFTSGPAAVLGIHLHLTRTPFSKRTLDVGNLASLTRTTVAGGTPSDGIVRALGALGIAHSAHAGSVDVLDVVEKGADAGDLVLVRTKAGSEDGWLVVYGRRYDDRYEDQRFRCFDPARGRIVATTPEMADMLATGGREVYRVPGDCVPRDVRIATLGSLDAEQLDRVRGFEPVHRTSAAGSSSTADLSDPAVTRVLIVDGSPVGVHHMSLATTSRHLDESLAELRGVESLSLAMDPKFIGMGFEEMLADVPALAGADYAWSKGADAGDGVSIRVYVEPWLLAGRTVLPRPSISKNPTPADATMFRIAVSQAAPDDEDVRLWANRVLLPHVATRSRFEGPGKDVYDSVRILVKWVCENRSAMRLTVPDLVELHGRPAEPPAPKQPFVPELDQNLLERTVRFAAGKDRGARHWVENVFMREYEGAKRVGPTVEGSFDFARDLTSWVAANAERDGKGRIAMPIREAIAGMVADRRAEQALQQSDELENEVASGPSIF